MERQPTKKPNQPTPLTAEGWDCWAAMHQKRMAVAMNSRERTKLATSDCRRSKG